MAWLAWAVGGGAALGTGTSCIELNPNHCANRSNTCAAELVCDPCTAVNDGCVPLADATLGCVEGLDSMGSTGTSGAETTASEVGDSGSSIDDTTTVADASDDSTTEVVPTCETEMGPDPSCPDTAPYCSAGTCQTCGQLGPGGCMQMVPEAPACDADTGLCVECTADSDTCPDDRPICGPDHRCRACVAHPDCPESACNFVSGACLPADQVYVVQRNAANCPGEGQGTPEYPFCSFTEARAAITSDTYTLRVIGGPDLYAENVEFAGQTVAVLGENGPAIDGVSNAISASVGATVFLSGLEISGSAAHGIACDSSTMWVDDTRISSNSQLGIDAEDCTMVVRRSVVDGNLTGGISHIGQSLWLENSFVSRNGTGGASVSGVRIDGAAATLLYSTIANNNATGNADAIACVGATNTVVRNSIVMGFEDPDESVGCSGAQITMSTSATDDSDLGALNDNVYLEQPWTLFVNFATGDLHVLAGGPFEGVALWEDGDPVVDIDGEPRPFEGGPADYCGADVP